MKVLIACEESQAVCIEGRRLGHEVYSCDIQPCSGGHPEWHIQGDVIPHSKKTCLWLKGLPCLKPTNVVVPEMSWVSGGSKDAKGNPRVNKGTVYRDSKTRSKTFPGIAKAMAEQWMGEGEV